MKALVSYYGGKQRIALQIVRYLPKHTVYVEPFAGGAAVFFAKGTPALTSNNHYQEVLNDKHELLINFYRVLQGKDKNKLIEKLEYTPYSRSEHKRAIDICKNGHGSNLERAWAYFVNINCSFTNIENGGFRYGMYSRNFAHSWKNKKILLNQVLNRMQNAHIECDDAIKIIKRYDTPQTLFYCDPPYINAEQSYQIKYTIDQYQELIDTLDNIEGSFVLSGYNNKYVPDKWKKIEIEAVMSASNGKIRKNIKRIECLWIVDKSDTVRPEIKKIFNSLPFIEFFNGSKLTESKIIPFSQKTIAPRQRCIFPKPSHFSG